MATHRARPRTGRVEQHDVEASVKDGRQVRIRQATAIDLEARRCRETRRVKTICAQTLL